MTSSRRSRGGCDYGRFAYHRRGHGTVCVGCRAVGGPGHGALYDLISPIGLAAWAAACAEGAQKYGDYNWERGMPTAELLNHAIAHIYAYLSGDRSEDHLGHALWNVGGAIHAEVCWPDLSELRGAGCACPGKQADQNTQQRVAAALARKEDHA